MKTKKPRRRPARVLREAPPAIVGLEWACEGKEADLNWFLPGALPAGSLVLLEGRKCTGKSSVAAALAAAVTGGPTVPGWTGPRDGRVIWQAGEDSWESVVLPRLHAAGACLDRVARMRPPPGHQGGRWPLLPEDLDAVRDFLLAADAKLLVLDPLYSLASTGLDLRIPQQARLFADPLAGMLADVGALGVMVRHLRKGQGGDARDAGLGSGEIGNAARAVLRCDEHPYERGRFVLSVVGCNWGKKMATQLYQITEGLRGYPRLIWHGSTELDADTIAEGRGSSAERDEWNDADRLLAALIGTGWRRVSEIRQEANEAEITPRILRRAKDRLNIPSVRKFQGGKGWWEWGPPKGGWPAGLVEDQVEEGGARTGGRLDPFHTPGTNGKPVKSPKAPKAPHKRTRPPRRPKKGGSSGEQS